ncbi:MAG TPA: hypothetical protein VKO42_02000, partial [Patescibacteria group bacterium]|nr:hypothetical protein [Patescibacteria group bacterium]
MSDFENPHKQNSAEEDAESLVKGMMGEDAFDKEGVERPEDSWKEKQGEKEQEKDNQSQSEQKEKELESPESQGPQEEFSQEKAETEEVQEQEKEEEKEVSKKVAERFKSEMNIKRDQLEDLDGFVDLSEGQQLLVLENLKQLTLGRIEDEASEEFKQDIKTSKFLGKLWKGITKHYQLGKLQEDKGEQILYGGMRTHEQTLRQLVDGLEEFGPEVEENNGNLNIKFLSMEEGLDPRQYEKLNKFNNIANEFARIPEEWKHSNSKTKRNKFEKIQEQYEKAKQEALNIKKELQGEQEAGLEMNRVEFQTYANQLLNNDPEAEKALENIENQKAWKNSFKDILTEKGLFLGGGFIARSGATALLGAVGSSLAAFGAPLGAAGIGGVRGWQRTQEELANKDKSARKGGSEKDEYQYHMEQKVGTKKDVVDWDYYSESLQDLKDILESEESGDKQKQEAVKSLQHHLEEIEYKINQGEIDFGQDDSRFYNQYSLVQELGQAQACQARHNYLYSDKLASEYQEDKKVVEEYTDNLEKTVEENRKKYARNKALQSAATSAGFAFAGQWLGGKFADYMGWGEDGEEVAPETEQKAPEQTSPKDSDSRETTPKQSQQKEAPEKTEKSQEKAKPNQEKKIFIGEEAKDSDLNKQVWNLKSGDFEKLKNSSIKDPDIINKIAENKEVADWEVRLGESDLDKGFKKTILNDSDLAGSLEEFSGAVSKLAQANPKLVEKVLQSGAISEQDIRVLDSNFSLSVKKELLDLSDASKKSFGQVLDNLDPRNISDKVINFIKNENLSGLREEVGRINSLAQTVEQGDNITSISKKLLSGDNVSVETKDAFIDNYYPDHEDITKENREKLLEQAVNKMSISNLKMGDGNDLKNLIYEGNEVHINSETGDIYVEKGSSKLEAKAVGEGELRENWADHKAKELGLDPEKVDFGSDELGGRKLSTTVEVNGEEYEVIVDENNNWQTRAGEKQLSGKFDRETSLASVKEEIRTTRATAEAAEITKNYIDPRNPSDVKALKSLGVDFENGLSVVEKEKLRFLAELTENKMSWNEAGQIFDFIDETKNTRLQGLFSHTLEDYHKLQDFLGQINYDSFQGSEGDRYLRELASIKFSPDAQGAEKSARFLFYDVIGHFDLPEVVVSHSSGGTEILLPHENWGPDSDWEITIDWQGGKISSDGPLLWGKEGDISKGTLDKINNNINEYFSGDSESAEEPQVLSREEKSFLEDLPEDEVREGYRTEKG